MRSVYPTFQLIPTGGGRDTFHMWVGYHIREDDKIVASVDLFDMEIPAIRQCGESEIAVMETAMDGADAIYHELSRRIRKQIESNMRANARSLAASETLTDS